jgi:DNA helicase-2/ATP-dependent DNA helicase PcrA
VSTDRLLDTLDPEQRAAVTSPAAPLAILAPAGSGKTRVLTRRIAWRAREGSLDARHVLAVTFTRKAAGELSTRLRRLGVDSNVTAGTFHALALAQLRRRAEEAGREPPRVLDRKARVLARALAGSGSNTNAMIPAIAAEIEWAKARMITPETFVDAATHAQRRLPCPPYELADVYARYEREKRRRRVVDFDDLLWYCAHALESDETFAAAQQWRFRHFFVDEFQDASPLAVRLIAAWVGDRRDLCVVGDIAQSIYGFAGGDPEFLDQFEAHFPRGERILLTRNYRSTPQVVRAAGAALGRDQAATVTAIRHDGPIPHVWMFEDDRREADGVVRVLREAHARGVAWRDMAVLFRTNAQSALFERACTHASVPFTIATRDRFFDRPEVQALIGAMQEADRAAPARPFHDHLSDLMAGTTDDADDDDADDEAAIAEPLDLAAIEREAIAASTLVALGTEYLAAVGGAGTLGGFLAWAEVATRGEATFEGDAIELATFHRAKGLEWSIVCVTGLEAGLVPISYATTDTTVAEERRLLHVALSRAHDELHLSWARRRAFGGRAGTREPSPWLTAVAGASAPGPADRIPDPLAAIDEVRRVLASVTPPEARPRPPRRRRGPAERH